MQTQVSRWCKTSDELQGMAEKLTRSGYKTFFKEKKARSKIFYSLFRDLTSQEIQDIENGILILDKNFLSFKPSNKRGEI